MLAVGAMSAAVSGCGGTHCSDAAQCEGGNETDQEACEIQVEAMYEQGEIDGCNDLVDEWQDCMTEGDLCQQVGNETVWGKQCETLFQAVSTCLEGDGVVRL